MGMLEGLIFKLIKSKDLHKIDLRLEKYLELTCSLRT